MILPERDGTGIKDEANEISHQVDNGNEITRMEADRFDYSASVAGGSQSESGTAPHFGLMAKGGQVDSTKVTIRADT